MKIIDDHLVTIDYLSTVMLLCSYGKGKSLFPAQRRAGSQAHSRVRSCPSPPCCRHSTAAGEPPGSACTQRGSPHAPGQPGTAHPSPGTHGTVRAPGIHTSLAWGQPVAPISALARLCFPAGCPLAKQPSRLLLPAQHQHNACQCLHRAAGNRGGCLQSSSPDCSAGAADSAELKSPEKPE